MQTDSPSPTPSPLPAKEPVSSSEKLLAEQRALRRSFGPSVGDYFRTHDDLRGGVAQIVNRTAVRDWSEAARISRVGANAGIFKAATDARRLSLGYGASGTAAQLTKQMRALQRLGEDPNFAGFANATVDAQSLSRVYGASGIGAGLAEQMRGRRKVLDGETAASLAGLSRAARAARMPLGGGASALLELAEQMHARHRLISEQNSALLATMSAKRGLLATSAIASAFNMRTSAIGTLPGAAGRLGIAEQMLGLRNVITKQNSAVLAAMSLRRGLLGAPIATSVIGGAFNVRADAIGAMLGGAATLGLREWFAAQSNAPTWDEIYGVALRELRAELSGRAPLGRVTRIHMVLLLLEAMLTTAPWLPAATRDEIHKASMLALAIHLSVTACRELR